MIDRHYVTTIDRYVDDLGRKSSLIVHTGATPQLMREVAVLARTVSQLAEASLEEGSPGPTGVEPWPGANPACATLEPDWHQAANFRSLFSK